MIVDLEMAVGSCGVRSGEGLSGTERLYRESVLQTGLLPLYTWNSQGKGVNVGAINGRGGQLVPLSMPVVVNPGTVRMHIEYRQPRMKEGNNLATLEGEFLEPYEFLGEIQSGFRDAYVFLTGNREKTSEKLALQGEEGPGQGWAETFPGAKKERVEEPESSGIGAAEKLAGILLREAIWSEEKEEAGWISIMMAGYGERGYMMLPMDDYLYGGLAGVAVFFAELVERTGNEEYCRMRRILTDALFRHTDRLSQKESAEKLPTGAYSGEASLAFAYMLLYSIDGDSAFLPYLWKQCQITAEGLAADREYDVLGGNAGAILVFLKAYRLTGREQYRTWAREAGDYLLRSATVYDYGMGWVHRSVGTALTGFAHGAAGIMLALARLGHEAQEEKYLEAAYQAYRYEEHYLREELQDWEDLREEEQASPRESRMAWCHGWGGIVMARMEAERYAEGTFREELSKVRDFIRKKVSGGSDRKRAFWKADFCLCHGRCGNQALLARMGDVGERLTLQEEGAEEKKRIAGRICQWDMEELLGLQECSNYGLMGGIAGIGYSCLCGAGKVYDLLCVD